MEFRKTFRPWNPQTYAHQTLARLRLQPTDACANSLWTNGSGVSKTGY